MKKFLLMCVVAVFCFSCANIDPASKYPNMVADMDSFSLGTVTVMFDRTFSSQIKEHQIEAIFHPRYNEVSLEFRYELISYRQYWNMAGRQQFIDALAKYKEDFSQKNLNLKYSKSRAAYGRHKGRIEWETFKFTTTNKASPTFEFGYRFRGDYPYFSVIQLSAKDENENSSRANLESSQFSMYFTRSQGDALAGVFNQEFLLGLVEERSPRTGDSVKDEYFESAETNPPGKPVPEKSIPVDEY